MVSTRVTRVTQVTQVTHGYTWLHMVTHGYTWLHSNLRASCIGTCGAHGAAIFLEINLSGFLEKLLFGADVMPEPTPQSPSVCGVVMSVGMYQVSD